MKRYTGLLAILAALLFLLAWDFTPQASANKEKREQAAESTDASSRSRKDSVFIKSSKDAVSSSEEESEAAERGADAEAQEEECDPDMPLGFTGKFDQGEFLQKR